mmetsp:Transcript_4566/g.8808  ORF Transcript_4566/g.8808 Transcript_4566/m.8808 type:complete len:183 (+) Transcript_4566:370-918(+)
MHPLFMTLAFVLCFPYGIGSYRMEVMDADSRELAVPPPMPKLRRRHAAWQIWGGIFALGGLVIIIVNKIHVGHFFALPSVHAVFGILTIIGIIVQCIFGSFKLAAWEDAVPEKVHTWHGIAGLVVFSFAIFTIALGGWEWSAVAAVPAVIIIISAVLVWLATLLIWFFIDPESASRTYQQIV